MTGLTFMRQVNKQDHAGNKWMAYCVYLYVILPRF